MRQILMSFVMALTFVMPQAFAGSELEKDMKEIDKIFKTVKATVNDPAKNQDNAAAVGKMIDLFDLALKQVPTIVKKMPQAQQDAAMAEYQDRIDHAIDLCTQLQTAFTNGNNAEAADLVKQLNTHKHDSHDKFDP